MVWFSGVVGGVVAWCLWCCEVLQEVVWKTFEKKWDGFERE